MPWSSLYPWSYLRHHRWHRRRVATLPADFEAAVALGRRHARLVVDHADCSAPLYTAAATPPRSLPPPPSSSSEEAAAVVAGDVASVVMMSEARKDQAPPRSAHPGGDRRIAATTTTIIAAAVAAAAAAGAAAAAAAIAVAVVAVRVGAEGEDGRGPRRDRLEPSSHGAGRLRSYRAARRPPR